MGVLPGSLVLETPLYRTPTSEDIEDVVDAWNFSPGYLLPVVTKEVSDTVWVLHGFQSPASCFGGFLIVNNLRIFFDLKTRIKN